MSHSTYDHIFSQNCSEASLVLLSYDLVQLLTICFGLIVIFERGAGVRLEIFGGDRRITGVEGGCFLTVMEDVSFLSTIEDDDFLGEPITEGYTSENSEYSSNESELMLPLRRTEVARGRLSKKLITTSREGVVWDACSLRSCCCC